MNKKVLVIGAGPAGMTAAGFAASYGAEVCVLERNPHPGKKLNITGKGRCNVTNSCDMDTLMNNIPGDGRFLYSAFSAFTPEDVVDFFQRLGVELKVERGGRVFPVSDRARDITEALQRFMAEQGVKFANGRAEEIIVNDGAVCGVRAGGRVHECDAVILATGGMSYPLTGSTGDGYRMAEKLGHEIVSPSASLVPLVAEPELCKRMQGLTLKNVVLKLFNSNDRLLFSELGEMLFTHFGVSGPLVLSASAHMRKADKYRIEIDLKPALDEKKLDARILRDFEERKNKDLGNALGALLPSKMIAPVVEKAGLHMDGKVHSISREQRKKLVEELKGFSISVSGKRPIEEAVITSGGVSLKQIKPKTMESKFVKGLYFAGEILDVDGYTGGFNLQIAWSTGYAAGIASAQI